MHDLVVIDPVTRIEGHAKITIALDDAGQVADARFHVTEFRGFEEFCKGRPVWEMPSLTARTCGICPVSHLLASAKTGDAIMGVTIPPTAVKLRRIANLGQIIQSHALSFFHLSAPDLLLGHGRRPRRPQRLRADGGRAGTGPARHPAAQLRPVGDRGDRRTQGALARHRPWRHRRTDDRGDQGPAPAGLVEAQPDRTKTPWQLFTGMLDTFEREVDAFGSFPSLHLGLANEPAPGSTTTATSRSSTPTATWWSTGIDPADYRTIIGEARRHDSYLKSPYFKPRVERRRRSGRRHLPGRTAGTAQRVRDHGGAAGRRGAGRVSGSGPGASANSSFFYHYARLIEILAATERMAQHLDDPAITDTKVRATAGINRVARRRGFGGAAGHALPRVHRRRARHAHRRQHDHRHRPEQPGDERHGPPDRQGVDRRARDSRGRSSTGSRPASGRSIRA